MEGVNKMRKKVVISFIVTAILTTSNTIYAVMGPILYRPLSWLTDYAKIIIWGSFVIFGIIYFLVSKKTIKHKILVMMIVLINAILLTIFVYNMIDVVAYYERNNVL